MLRDAEWLTPARALAWCRITAVKTALIALGWVVLSRGGVDRNGNPLETDFLSFWTASQLALAGHPEAAYVPPLHGAAQARLLSNTAAESGYMAFFYPPSFLLICLPLALLRYMLSLTLWLAGGFAALTVCLCRLLPMRWAIVPVAAFPGVLMNFGSGQNGFLSSTCWCGVMLLMQRW